ncbi:Predicted Zn-dependent peptidase [Friedmanniella luteola]|uniref:Predicted Zn-dependent peptidase n=1 Tax=Friedmanniella luteola TaxID=546871 RepID=A0A1H1VI66_9ACTN|nr:pitrilysin family protein [Friedmanniella luteola]SDS84442.1 Predicted Zn-dependent peptidase [Friedmanniella luteola]
MTTSPSQPPVGPPGAWSFPTPVEGALRNGIRTLTFDRPGQHVVSAHLVLDLPLDAEERDLEGVATITARVLDEGSRAHPGEEFAELVETEGAGFGVELTLAGTQLVLDVPASRLDRALELFAEAVTTPALADDDVRRHVTLRLAEIEQAQANSAQTATHTFKAVTFDAGSRASRMNGGEAATVAAVTPDAVRAFHARHYGPAGATLVLAGDFSGLDPVALAETHLGGWRNDAQVRVPYRAPAPGGRSTVVVDRPGAVQADVRFGAFSVDRTDPRWADLTVASYAMGGAFLSRLNAVLREDKGYTYGVRMAFSPMRSGGSFAVQGSFRTEVVADALRLTRELLQTAERPFTEDEVREAVAYFVGVSPLRYATADGVAEQAGTNLLLGLPVDYVDRSLAALADVTPASATRAFQELVRLDELGLVVVGDADVVAEPLRAVGFPDLEVRPR